MKNVRIYGACRKFRNEMKMDSFIRRSVTWSFCFGWWFKIHATSIFIPREYFIAQPRRIYAMQCATVNGRAVELHEIFIFSAFPCRAYLHVQVFPEKKRFTVVESLISFRSGRGNREDFSFCLHNKMEWEIETTSGGQQKGIDFPRTQINIPWFPPPKMRTSFYPLHLFLTTLLNRGKKEISNEIILERTAIYNRKYLFVRKEPHFPN